MDMDKTQKIKSPLRFKTIPKVCSWCKKVYELSMWEVEGNRRTGVSHGMCPECHKKYLAMYQTPSETDKN